MICPQCQAEYREGFTICSTCQMQLIAKPESATPNVDKSFRTFPMLGAALLGVATIFVYFLSTLRYFPAYYRWIALGLAISLAVWAKVFRVKD
jgi:hypothetical protein